MKKLFYIFVAFMSIIACSGQDDIDQNLLLGEWNCNYIAIKTTETKTGKVLNDTVYPYHWKMKFYENETLSSEEYFKEMYHYSVHGDELIINYNAKFKIEELTKNSLRLYFKQESFNYDYEKYITKHYSYVFSKMN